MEKNIFVTEDFMEKESGLGSSAKYVVGQYMRMMGATAFSISILAKGLAWFAKTFVGKDIVVGLLLDAFAALNISFGDVPIAALSVAIQAFLWTSEGTQVYNSIIDDILVKSTHYIAEAYSNVGDDLVKDVPFDQIWSNLMHHVASSGGELRQAAERIGSHLPKENIKNAVRDHAVDMVGGLSGDDSVVAQNRDLFVRLSMIEGNLREKNEVDAANYVRKIRVTASKRLI